MNSYKISNPLRFFGFFGLFLIFMFMAVKSCTNKKSETEFVTAGEISDSLDNSLEKGNSLELEEFIEDVKEEIKNKDMVPVVKKVTKKPEETVKKIAVKKIKKIVPKVRASSVSSIIKKGANDKIDVSSKLKIKKDVKFINSAVNAKVTVYGSYFPGELKTKGFVRAAKIKNELIRSGIKNSVTVYILPELQSDKSRFGRLKISTQK